MELLDGKKLGKKILNQAKKEVKALGLKPTLAAVLVGDNKASEAYVRQKRKACEEAGIGFQLEKFPKNITQADIEKEVDRICASPAVTSVIIQLPLPKSLDEQKVLNKVPLKKDVDMLSEIGMDRLSSGKAQHLPPVVCAISSLIEAAGIAINGKEVAVIGAGKLVGMPVAVWASKLGASVTVINSQTKNPELHIKNADIVISGVGKPGLVKGAMIKKGAVVIDAGTAFKNGKTVGDVEFESVEKVASVLSPVPGGVGPMTVACLIANVAKQAK